MTKVPFVDYYTGEFHLPSILYIKGLPLNKWDPNDPQLHSQPAANVMARLQAAKAAAKPDEALIQPKRPPTSRRPHYSLINNDIPSPTGTPIVSFGENPAERNWVMKELLRLDPDLVQRLVPLDVDSQNALPQLAIPPPLLTLTRPDGQPLKGYMILRFALYASPYGLITDRRTPPSFGNCAQNRGWWERWIWRERQDQRKRGWWGRRSERWERRKWWG
ncbi:hypothetical protein B0H12DRAFT_1097854 [Mycena haematopus]|nr:hypothetical protein B0H12DRAFT_1097854 [Mycena haematopus]